MSDLIVPGQQQQPTYPQIGVNMAPQGVIFNIQLGPTVSINHLVTHEDMDNIELMRRAALKEMREQAETARNVMMGNL